MGTIIKPGLLQKMKENIAVRHRCAGGVLLAGLIVGLALTPGSVNPSVSATADEVDDYIETRMRQLHIPGISLAVVRNGQVIKAQGYGLADLELNVSATTETVYEIGSITKPFTATAIMMLVEDGRVSLDDRITKYFAEAPEAWSRITIRQLLNHTSGIQNHVAVPGYLNKFQTSLSFQPNLTRDDLLRLFFKLPLEFQPGETWAYDNTGYYLLGIIIERATGQSYWQFLNERIFQPLGMTATHSTDPRPIVPNRASGYEWVNNGFENRPVLTPFVAFSAGALQSTVEDMARWDAALYTEKLLKKSSLDQMWAPAKISDDTPPPFSYGLGWFIDSYHGHRLVQHSGGTPGYSSVVYRFLDDERTVILLTNHADRMLDSVAIEIAGIYLPPLRRPQGRLDPDPQTSLTLREVAAGLLNGQYDPALFTPAMRVFLSTATGKAFWNWLASHGTLTSFTFSNREDVDDGCVVRYKVVLGNTPYWLSARMMRDGRIAQIRWW